jgi:cysteinyl-tRNA synthetase
LRAGGRSVEDVEAVIAERAAARASKQWQRADELRRNLLDAGIALEDGAAGTTWRPTSWGVEPSARKGSAR